MTKRPRRPAKLPDQLHHNTYADHSIAEALDGNYVQLRKRLLTINHEELNLIAAARRGDCNRTDCVQLITREELELIDRVLAELQATGRVKTPRAKVLDARSNDNIALMVLQVEAEMQRHWTKVPQGIRELAYRHVELRLCGRRKYQSIKNATIRFEKHPEKVVEAEKLISQLLALDIRLWDPAIHLS